MGQVLFGGAESKAVFFKPAGQNKAAALNAAHMRKCQSVLDGHDVGDEIVVRPGQALMFTRRAGEKG